jgi:hypothetical protein
VLAAEVGVGEPDTHLGPLGQGLHRHRVKADILHEFRCRRENLGPTSLDPMGGDDGPARGGGGGAARHTWLPSGSALRGRDPGATAA